MNQQQTANDDIKAVIFDCFGVLVANSWLPFQQRYFAHDEDLFAYTTDLNWQCDAGQISFGEFASKIAHLANISDQAVVAELKTLPTNAKLFDYIFSNISGKYLVGLLSNVGENMLSELFNAEQNAVFDAVVLSFEIGHTKPEPEAYAAILERLNIEPYQAAFIDDQPRFVAGAQEYGLKAIQYQSIEQVTAELEQLLFA